MYCSGRYALLLCGKLGAVPLRIYLRLQPKTGDISRDYISWICRYCVAFISKCRR